MNVAVALFTYNRPDHTKRTLDALRKAANAEDLPLYVFADGPRTESDDVPVSDVHRLIEATDWAGGINPRFAVDNQGLANSIISGVSYVLDNHDAVIVLEDDIVLAPSAINYFSQALDRFCGVSSVGTISGFAHPPQRLRIPRDYPYDSYFLTRNSSWGWATWADRWSKVNWDIDLWKVLRTDPYVEASLRGVSPDLPQMLDNQMNGLIDSWAVRFTLHHFLHGLVSLTPIHSYVENIGMDGSGTHTGTTNRYKNNLQKAVEQHSFPPVVALDKRITEKFAKLYRRRPFLLRAIGRLKRLFSS